MCLCNGEDWLAVLRPSMLFTSFPMLSTCMALDFVTKPVDGLTGMWVGLWRKSSAPSIILSSIGFDQDNLGDDSLLESEYTSASNGVRFESLW